MNQEHKQLIVSKTLSIKESWQQLNSNSHKILFVINDDGVLIGSVTDGDIRRWILNDKPITDRISAVMNIDPVVVHEKDSLDSVKEIMLKGKILCLPAVDAAGRPTQFYFWDAILGEVQKKSTESIDVPVVIMAGGRGVRLDPFTKVLPKPLIPIGDKPVIEQIMDRFVNYHVKQFYVSVNYRSNMIRAYFQDNDSNKNIHFFEEGQPLGTAGSLSMLKDKINSTFIVSNCDILVEANYADLLKFHKEGGYAITLVCSMRHFSIPYGVVEIENGGDLKKISEKPEFDYLVNTGLYVLEPELLHQIPEGHFYHITHLIDKLIKEEKKVGVYPIGNKAWIDIGELEEYKKHIQALR